MPIHCNNATVVGIANKTVKKQHSCDMEMRYFWVCDQIKHGHIKVHGCPSLENLADYLSKHQDEAYHIKVRSTYLHMNNSSRTLQRAPTPRELRGGVGKQAGDWVQACLLPTIPMVSPHAGAA